MIVRKRPAGWIWRFQGELIWVILGVYLGLTSIWMWGTLFLIMDVIGYYKWRKEQANVSANDVKKST
jgi:hypothetical protein